MTSVRYNFKPGDVVTCTDDFCEKCVGLYKENTFPDAELINISMIYHSKDCRFREANKWKRPFYREELTKVYNHKLIKLLYG